MSTPSLTDELDLLLASVEAPAANLREMTKRVFSASSDKKARMIKVAFVDQPAPPRVVLWEIELPVTGLDVDARLEDSNSIRDLLTELRRKLPQELKSLDVQLRFAGATLGELHGEQEHLRQYLAIYTDKIYAVPLGDEGNRPQVWRHYDAIFSTAKAKVRANPNLYLALCKSLSNLIVTANGVRDIPQVSQDAVFQHLTLLRSLPESMSFGCLDQAERLIEDADSAYLPVAQSVRELIELLDKLERDQLEAVYAAVIYNVTNALEWLSYVAPRMYVSESLSLTPNGQERQVHQKPLHEALAVRLNNYIVGEDYRLANRLEAAWALGWASVSSIAVATYVHSILSKNTIQKLKSTVLKHVAGGAYLRASLTLASFGPARVTAGGEKSLQVGGFLPEGQTSVRVGDALVAASDVVYEELGRIVRSGQRARLVATGLAGFVIGVLVNAAGNALYSFLQSVWSTVVSGLQHLGK